MNEFTEAVIKAIQDIPKGKVSTYGQIAKQAGDKMGARAVAEILHLHSEKYKLPWQRVLGADGKIAINNPDLASLQKKLLQKEGVVFVDDSIDLRKYLFIPFQSTLDMYERKS